MNIGKNIDGLINGGGAFLSPQEILAKKGDGGCDCDLPKPTPQDAGKAVTVDSNGDFVFTNVSGHFIVTVTWVNTTATLNKSYKEIADAIANGLVPIFISDYGTAFVFYWLKSVFYSEGSGIPYYIEIIEFSNEANEFNLYTFASATETGTPTYGGGLN